MCVVVPEEGVLLSANSQLKRGGDHNIYSSSWRLVRGFAAAQIMLTMVITAFNIGKIAKFIYG